MKLEQQVCSLELAKQLKDLRIIADSLYFWVWNDYNRAYITNSIMLVTGSAPDLKQHEAREWYPAYTVAELGEMLPNGNYSFRYIGVEKWAAGNNLYNYNANMQGKMVKVTEKESKTEADARAKMLIYLKGNKLID